MNLNLIRCPCCGFVVDPDDVPNIDPNEIVTCWNPDEKMIYEFCKSGCTCAPFGSDECVKIRKHEGFVPATAEEVWG